MAGPQVQHSHSHAHSHSQRPNSAYYMGLNGGSNSHHVISSTNTHTHTTTTATSVSASSSAHTGLHALREMSNDMELIYRGNNTNLVTHSVAATSDCIKQQPQTSATATAVGTAVTDCNSSGFCNNVGGGSGGGDGRGEQIVSIAGPGPSATDALIVPSGSAMKRGKLAKSKTVQRSVEIVVDASQFGVDTDVGGADDDADAECASGSKSGDDVEQGRRMSHHRRRPLHRRFISYLRNLFHSSTTQNDSELEEFETPARYRPDSLSALSRTTRFTEDEIKRIYRGFKAECPTGVVKEDTFKVIYSHFFPQGANPTLYAHYVFNTLDTDNSGIISFEDFVQGLSILSRGSVDEKLRWTFSLYDINGDGHITREEMTEIVTAIYELVGRRHDDCPEEVKVKYKVEQLFQKMDKNQDGVVTLDEFLETCQNDEAISRSMSVFDSRDASTGDQRQGRQHATGKGTGVVGVSGGGGNHSRTRSSRNRRKQATLQQLQQHEQQEQQQNYAQDTQTLREKITDKAQPQPQQQLEQQIIKQKPNAALESHNLIDNRNSQKTKLNKISDNRVQRTATRSTSSDASTASSCDSDTEDEVAISERLSSMCHHCLRPQIEMQLRHLRPQQRQQWSQLLTHHRSKRRSSKTRKAVSWSGRAEGGGRDDGSKRNGVDGRDGAVDPAYAGNGANDYALPANSYTTTGVHWTRRDVSAAVRYRCPQVGPKPAPYHFHHPQQLQNAYQLQLLLQQCQYVPPAYYHNQHQQQEQQQFYHKRPHHSNNMDYNNTSTTTATTAATTITIECESQSPQSSHTHKQQQQQVQQHLLHQQPRNQNMQFNQNLYAPTTNKTDTSSVCSDYCCNSNTASLGRVGEAAITRTTASAGTLGTLQPPYLSNQQHGGITRGTVSDSELQLQRQPTTVASPSLVKVRAWYTVAKQGVSC
ncbi:uncharacterized protein [Eurosta solidaginis]|uniref:uncharacterized protein n=1 Tax=Eurosta solidaginis TaxID=178769 RepID=UPI0035310724